MHYTLCDLFSDLTQNAVEAGASIITVVLTQTERDLVIIIEDNGSGMAPEQLQKATDPFYTDGIKHPGRKIGLGIPFLIQTAESTGGSWGIQTGKNGARKIAIGDLPNFVKAESSDIIGSGSQGTVVECRLDMTNIDTPPIGDVPGYFRQILTFAGAYEMIIRRKAPLLDYEVRRSELLDALGLSEAGAFEDANALSLLGQYLESCEQ